MFSQLTFARYHSKLEMSIKDLCPSYSILMKQKKIIVTPTFNREILKTLAIANNQPLANSFGKVLGCLEQLAHPFLIK